MKKKRSVGVTMFVISLVNIFLLINVFAETERDGKAKFEERLFKLCTFGAKEDLQEFTKAGIALQNFSDEFPNSKYADDAQYVVLWFSSMTKIDIPRWEKFLKKYPNGKVDDFTIEYMSGAIGQDVFEMHIPYSLLLTYLKGQKAFVDKNFDETAKYFSDLVTKLDHNDPKLKGVFGWVYPTLLLSYERLNRREEYEKHKLEYITMFPERKERIEIINRYEEFPS